MSDSRPINDPPPGGPPRSDALPKHLVLGAFLTCCAVLAVVLLWPGVVR